MYFADFEAVVAHINGAPRAAGENQHEQWN
jgi:hypothetical protein